MSARTTDGDPEVVLTDDWDDDVLDDPEVDVYGDVPDDDLADAVHQVVRDTIMAELDGNDRQLVWEEVDGGRGPDYKLKIIGGMPETVQAPGQWLPPYRTREKFEGADASGDGLLTNLPDGWQHEVERGDSVFGFYRVD